MLIILRTYLHVGFCKQHSRNQPEILAFHPESMSVMYREKNGFLDTARLTRIHLSHLIPINSSWLGQKHMFCYWPKKKKKLAARLRAKKPSWYHPLLESPHCHPYGGQYSWISLVLSHNSHSVPKWSSAPKPRKNHHQFLLRHSSSCAVGLKTTLLKLRHLAGF